MTILQDSEYITSTKIENDLRFNKPILEERFQLLHMETQKSLDVQFHIARALAWAAVGIRMLYTSTARKQYLSAFITLFGAFSTLFPAAVHTRRVPGLTSQAACLRWRPFIVLMDNILQVSLGCFTHSAIYPEYGRSSESWRDIPLVKALAVTITGNGNAWLLMSSLLGSLPFHFALVQQAILVIIMLLSSRTICSQSFSLQKGTVSVSSWFLGGLQRVSSLMMGPPPTDRPWGGFLRDTLLQDHTTLSSEDVCVMTQSMSLLIIGFVFPTMYLFFWERAARVRFLRSWGEHVTAPLPSLVEYAQFAVPTVTCLYVYVGSRL